MGPPPFENEIEKPSGNVTARPSLQIHPGGGAVGRAVSLKVRVADPEPLAGVTCSSSVHPAVLAVHVTVAGAVTVNAVVSVPPVQPLTVPSDATFRG